MAITKSNFFDPQVLSSLGIVDWGYTEIAEAQSFQKYQEWVNQQYHGPLKYLADERKDKRQNLKNVYPDFQSALVFLFDYTAEKKKLLSSDFPLKMASYAYSFEGEDYHFVLKNRLDEIKKKLHGINAVEVIDTKPVLERDLAVRAGLGWIGKNSMLINRSHGSYFLIASLLLNQKLDIKKSELEVDHCGNCTKCIDACPTSCILDDRTIDASKCISTFTIEQFKEVEAPKGFEETDYFFGCDICQDVCPWNKKPLLEAEILETASERQKFFEGYFLTEDKSKLISKIESLSNREFEEIFKGTSIVRTTKKGILKNLKQSPR